MTLAEDATAVEEEVSIPTLSFDLNIDCDISGDEAVCVNVLGTGADETTLEPTTLAFSPFAVPVSTVGGETGVLFLFFFFHTIPLELVLIGLVIVVVDDSGCDDG